MSPELETALIGAGGALAAQFLVVATELEEGRWPARLKQPAYIFAVVCWLVAGATVAWLYAPLPRVAAFQIGLSIKLVLLQLGRLIPREIEGGDVR